MRLDRGAPGLHVALHPHREDLVHEARRIDHHASLAATAAACQGARRALHAARRCSMVWPHLWRGGRVAEGGGLLNRYRVKSPIEGSNPSLSSSYSSGRVGSGGEMGVGWSSRLSSRISSRIEGGGTALATG